MAQGLVTFCSFVIFRFGIVVVVVVVVKYLRGKTGNLMRPTGNMDFEAGDTFDVAAPHFALKSTLRSLWKGGTT